MKQLKGDLLDEIIAKVERLPEHIKQPTITAEDDYIIESTFRKNRKPIKIKK